MKKRNKKIAKIVIGSVGVASILAIVPACVVSCGSSSSNNNAIPSSTSNSTNNQANSTKSTSSSTASVPTVAPGTINLSANITSSKDNKVLGVMEKTNEFGFGSSVTLNANFSEPSVKLSNGQTKSTTVSYTWYENGSNTPIKDATSSTYVISCFNQDATYEVVATYTIKISANNKIIYTDTKTISSSIALVVNTSDLAISLSYNQNDTNTISDYGTYSFTPTITAQFTSNDSIILNPNNFPSGWTLNYSQINLPSSLKDSLPSPINLNTAKTLTSKIDVTNSYPIHVLLQQNNQTIATSNAINVCGLLATNGAINITPNLPNSNWGQLINQTNNEYAFASQVGLTSTITNPTFSLGANEQVKFTERLTFL